MTLKFEPERMVYDPTESLLRFFATDGSLLARCAISRAALIALEDDAQGGVDAMVTPYRRNRRLIQHIAQRNYRARMLEASGVVVRLEDIADEAPAPDCRPLGAS